MPVGPPITARKVYGRPWSRMASIPLSREVLAQVGKVLVECVVAEARKDFARQHVRPGDPEGLPDSENFFRSFGYKVGASSVEVTSTWPHIAQIVEGRDPFRMWWLTRQAGRTMVPLKQRDGKVIFRMAPATLATAWIHPGFAKHGFLERGVAAGRVKAMQILAQEAVRQLSKGDPFR